MARYKSYDYGQTAMIAVDLEKQLVFGSIEYVIHKLVEDRINISLFESNIKNDITGRLFSNLHSRSAAWIRDFNTMIIKI
jgi:hypothetical protein